MRAVTSLAGSGADRLVVDVRAGPFDQRMAKRHAVARARGRNCTAPTHNRAGDRRSRSLFRGLRYRTITLKERAVVQSQRGELAAPDATGIQSDHIASRDEAFSRPMAKHNQGAACGALRMIEPRHFAAQRFARTVLVFQFIVPSEDNTRRRVQRV